MKRSNMYFLVEYKCNNFIICTYSSSLVSLVHSEFQEPGFSLVLLV